MKTKVILIFILLCFINLKIFSQATLVHYKENSQALLFNLIGLSDLKAGPLEGGAGYQYYFKDNIATRSSFSISIFNEKIYPIPPDSLKSPIDSTIFTITFYPGIKYIFTKNSTIAGFTAFEILFGYSSEKIKNFNFSSGDEVSINSFLYGFALSIGAEWFAWENLSLSAEYKLKFVKETSTKKTKISLIEEEFDLPSKSIFGIGTGSYSFIISFYF